MAVNVTSPDGAHWQVRRALLRGKDGHGRRLRWRGPNADWIDAIQFVDLAEIPAMGSIGLAIGGVVLLVLVLLFLPAIALGLVQAVVLAVLFALAVLGATLFGRPILVRAEQPATGASTVWAVTGWGTSRQVRDQVVNAIESGLDPIQAVSSDAELVARRDALDEPN